MNLNLTGHRALVTGSSKGIGAACALELSRLGCEVICLARSEDLLAKITDSLDTSAGQKHSFCNVDLKNPTELSAKLTNLLSARGPISILVNNAGGPPAGNISSATAEEFLDAFNMHLLSSSLLAQMLLPGMKSKAYGRIINIISTSVKAPIPGLGVSNTIRAAVANWGKTLSQEVASFGITVNSVLPGATQTQRLTTLLEKQALKENKTIEEVKKISLEKIPCKRFADPSEIANVVSFLASPAASYVNGVAISVDGGRTPCL